jgi:hypothetical protein
VPSLVVRRSEWQPGAGGRRWRPAHADDGDDLVGVDRLQVCRRRRHLAAALRLRRRRGRSERAGSGGERPDLAALPQVVFTTPALAQAGLTEIEARERGFEVETLSYRSTRFGARSSGATPAVCSSSWRRRQGEADRREAWLPRRARCDPGCGVGDRARNDGGRARGPLGALPDGAEGLKLAAQTFERDVAKLSCRAA